MGEIWRREVGLWGPEGDMGEERVWCFPRPLAYILPVLADPWSGGKLCCCWGLEKGGGRCPIVRAPGRGMGGVLRWCIRGSGGLSFRCQLILGREEGRGRSGGFLSGRWLSSAIVGISGRGSLGVRRCLFRANDYQFIVS